MSSNIIRLASLFGLLITVSLACAAQYENQLKIEKRNTLKFDSSFILWKSLDESQRIFAYNVVSGGAQGSREKFKSIAQKAALNVANNLATIDELETKKQATLDVAKENSYIKIDKKTSVAAASVGGKSSSVAAASARTTVEGYSQEVYQQELQKNADELRAIENEKNARLKNIDDERKRFGADSSRINEYTSHADNQLLLIESLEAALQNNYVSPIRYRNLEDRAFSDDIIKESFDVDFDELGRIYVLASSKFKVRITKKGDASVVLGITDKQQVYQRYCLIDAKVGDVYTVNIQGVGDIRVVADEIREF